MIAAPALLTDSAAKALRADRSWADVLRALRQQHCKPAFAAIAGAERSRRTVAYHGTASSTSDGWIRTLPALSRPRA